MPSPDKMHPPINQIETINEVQPGIALCVKKEINPQIIPINDIVIKRKPIKNTIRNGFTEKDVMPSIAKFTILKNGYLLSPAYLSCLFIFLMRSFV